MPSETLLANSEHIIPHKNGIWSRLAGPLANRNRNITEFYLQPDHPWKAYSPGDIVQGSVVLTVSKSSAITHLVICLHGHARVWRNQVVPGDGPATSGFRGPGRGTRGTEYLGSGTASLFEDEVVLCGQGLLRKGVYQFKFQLRFPSYGIPSSLEFERGAISYSLTATLTRPTTIAPTLSCDRRLVFQDAIDVGYVPLPQPRIISLEPISKRNKMKARIKPAPSDQTSDPSSSAGSMSLGLFQGRSADRSVSDTSPPSPVLSDEASTNTEATSSQSFQIVHHSPLANAGSRKDSGSTSASTPRSSGEIRAKVQLLKAGFLPADIIPLRITVNHTKPNVRGLVIVTLYRQGRVDMHPAIPLASKGKGKGKGLEYECVYPRSRTGLGGLQFSSNAPSSVFRKDLCQMSAMMVIDPRTLTADVRTSLRIPEDIFPTMVNVPGGMIEFRYHVEIIIDICGQLGESTFLPRISLTSPMQMFTNNQGSVGGCQVTGQWADNILDTTHLRRGKNIVVTLLEVVIGSKDSTRPAKKSRGEFDSVPGRSIDVPENESPRMEDLPTRHDGDYPQRPASMEARGGLEHRRGSFPVFPQSVPPPEPQEEVDEKTRLRRQEELLLPSRPPDEGETSSPAMPTMTPTAPFIAEEAALHGYQSTYPGNNHPVMRDGAETANSLHPTDVAIPPYSQRPPLRIGGRQSYSVIDDKGEAERRRLMTQASSPPPADPEDGADTTPTPSADISRPSAPILTEEDEYNAHIFNRHSHSRTDIDSLPRYQR